MHTNYTCPYPSLSENAQPILGNLTFQKINMYVSGACTGFAVLSAFLLLFMHGTHLSRYNEQAKIAKIVVLVIWYSVLSFIPICYPQTYVYIQPWTGYAQSIALASFFLLMSELVSPFRQQREVFLAALEIKNFKSGKPPLNGMVWYRKVCISIFQYPVVAAVCAVATDVTQVTHTFCYWSSDVHFAHLWIEIAQTVSVSVAIFSAIRLYTVLRTHLKEHRPLAKLLAFKLIVGLAFLQSIIFWILKDAHVIKPTAHLTYYDIYVGIPTMLICIEMVPFSIFFWYAYSYRPYVVRKENRQDQPYQGGVFGWRIFVAVFDPREVFDGIVFAVQLFIESKSSPADPSAQPEAYGRQWYELEQQKPGMVGFRVQ